MQPEHHDPDHSTMRERVMELDHKIDLMAVEQRAAMELAKMQFLNMEREQQINALKLDGLGKLVEHLRADILEMAADPAKSMAGRTIQAEAESVRAELARASEDLQGLKEWQAGMQGAWTLVQFLSWSGAVALALGLLRIIKVIP